MLHEYIKVGLSEAVCINLWLLLPIAQMPNYCNSLGTYVCLFDFASILFFLQKILKIGNSILQHSDLTTKNPQSLQDRYIEFPL